MSVAFTREPDMEILEELPDRAVSPFRNLVTADGLALIETEVDRLQHELTRLQAKPQVEETTEERSAHARVLRELRYWTARRSSAELVPPIEDAEAVHFGSSITIERGGRKQTFRIVGEDEADPSKGLISYVSPLAKALTGRHVGEVAEIANSEVEITAIA